MTQAGTTTKVERLRIKTMSRGDSLLRVEHDLRNINSLLFVGAIRARQPDTDGEHVTFADFVRPISKETLKLAEGDVSRIRVVELSLNSPLDVLLEHVATGAAATGTLTAVYMIYNRVLKTAGKTVDFGDKYVDFKQKRSKARIEIARNDLIEEDLRDQLKMRRRQRKIRDRVLDAALRDSKQSLSDEDQEQLDQSIIEAAKALRIIKTLEIEESPSS